MSKVPYLTTALRLKTVLLITVLRVETVLFNTAFRINIVLSATAPRVSIAVFVLPSGISEVPFRCGYRPLKSVFATKSDLFVPLSE